MAPEKANDEEYDVAPAAPREPAPGDPMSIRLGVSEVGGTFHMQALALKEICSQIADLPPLELVVSNVGASIENAIRLDAGDLDIAFISAPWVAAARKAETPFSRRIDLRTVAPMNLGPNFFVAHAGSGLHNVSELHGKRLAIGLKTGGMTPHAEAVLGALGFGPRDVERVYVDFAEGARLLVAGEVDAQYQRPIPNKMMTELCQQIPVRVLRFTPVEIEAALKAVPCDQPVLMRKGAVPGLEEDIPQLGVLNLLATHQRCPEQVVYLVVRAIMSQARQLGELEPLFGGLHDLLEETRRGRCSSLEFDGVTLHPGAARAFAEAGFLG